MSNKRSGPMEQLVVHYSTDDRVDERTGLHVWILDLDKPVSGNALLRSLSLGEWSRAEVLKDEIGRNRYLARALHVRNILSKLTGLPPAAFEFGKDSCGKPRLNGFTDHPDHSNMDLSFSISHSDEVLAVAVAFGREVGVDLEKMSDKFDHDQVAEASFAKEDIENLRSLPEEERVVAFYRLWTQKEAVGKMEGSGILPSNNDDSQINRSVRIHNFEYTHNDAKLLGAVALSE